MICPIKLSIPCETIHTPSTFLCMSNVDRNISNIIILNTVWMLLVSLLGLKVFKKLYCSKTENTDHYQLLHKLIMQFSK